MKKILCYLFDHQYRLYEFKHIYCKRCGKHPEIINKQVDEEFRNIHEEMLRLEEQIKNLNK